jgi:hypothetical protein
LEYLEFMFQNMSFPNTWIGWMHACMTITMYVSVNGSPTSDFIVNKGLRQGNFLTLFLLLKGLTSLVQNTVQIESFKSFKVHEHLHY